jgi:hypothetical protein
MSDLKYCPFCGGEAEVGYANQHDKLFVVGCNTPMCYGNINHFTMVFVSKESAIDTWNTRIPLANIVQKLEKLPYLRSYHDYAKKGIVHKYLERNDVLDIVNQEINKEK